MLLKVIPAAEAPQVLSAMRERAAETNAEIAAAA